MDSTKIPEGYGAAWSDLPAEPGVGFRARQWARGRTWTSPLPGKKELLYIRPAATAVCVSAGAHETLKLLLAETADEWRAVQQRIRIAIGEGRLTRDGKSFWTIAETASVLDSSRRKFAALNIPQGSLSWVARETAVKNAVRVFKAFVLSGRDPYLDMPGKCPGATSIRLALGVNYRAPVVTQGEWAGMGTALGWMAPLSPAAFPENVASANYVETAHMDAVWRVRFVFVSERDAKPKGEGKPKAPKTPLAKESPKFDPEEREAAKRLGYGDGY